MPGRVDVIVRSCCVGRLQRDSRGRDVACTLDGPVPGSASTNRVHIHDGYDDTELGRVYRSGRRRQALNPDGRVVVPRAASRTEAVDQSLATPGPLFGDPADAVLHDL